MNEQRKQILSIIFALAILASGCAVASGGESGSTDATDVFSLEAVTDSTGDAAGNTDASTDADAASDGATHTDSTEGATESETSTEATTSTPATEATAATQATEAATEATKATTPTTAATTPSTEATTPATQATQATQAATEATTPATEAATQPATEATEPVTEATTPATEDYSDFDIDYYINFAKEYAVSIGLEVKSYLTWSWDNPIAAYYRLTNIEENIISRLDRYKNKYGFEAVTIWAEQDTEIDRDYPVYAIYIGYGGTDEMERPY